MSEASIPLLIIGALFLVLFTPVAYFATGKIASWFRPDTPLWRAALLSCSFWIAFFSLGQMIEVLNGRERSAPGLIELLWVVAHMIAFALRRARVGATT